MGVPTSEVSYISDTARRGDHEISYEYVVALEEEQQTFMVIKTWIHTHTYMYDMPASVF